jgi:DNA-binding MarR family transcriptional regulator
VKDKSPPRTATRAVEPGKGPPGSKQPTAAPPSIEWPIRETAPTRPVDRRTTPPVRPETRPAKTRVFPYQRQWRTIDQAYNAIFKLTELALLPHGLSLPQLYLLGVLKDRGGTVTTGDIAEAMVKASQTVTGLVDRLERAGLVERVFDRSDRRKTLVRLRGVGERKLEEALPVATRLAKELSAVLTDQELQDLRINLEKLRRAVMNRLG